MKNSENLALARRLTETLWRNFAHSSMDIPCPPHVTLDENGTLLLQVKAWREDGRGRLKNLAAKSRKILATYSLTIARKRYDESEDVAVGATYRVF